MLDYIVIFALALVVGIFDIIQGASWPIMLLAGMLIGASGLAIIFELKNKKK